MNNYRVKAAGYGFMRDLKRLNKFLVDFPDLEPIWANIPDKDIQKRYQEKIIELNNSLLESSTLVNEIYYDLAKKVGE